MKTVKDYVDAIKAGKVVTLWDEKASVMVNYLQSFEPELDVHAHITKGKIVMALEGVAVPCS